MLFLGSALLKAWYEEYRIGVEIERLQTATGRLEAKRLETLKWLQYVHSPAYVEEKARVDLNLAAPGEAVAVISRPAATAAQALVKAKPDPAAASGWQNLKQWWQYFFPAQTND